jgi:hypothetical protein
MNSDKTAVTTQRRTDDRSVADVDERTRRPELYKQGELRARLVADPGGGGDFLAP